MQRELEKVLRGVRIRCSIGLLLNLAGWSLVIGGGVFLGGLLVEKILAYQVFEPVLVWSSAIMGTLGVFIVWLSRFPRRMETAVLIDDTLRLKERVSTALALIDSQDVFAQAACAEARNTISHVQIRGHFPLKAGAGWFYAAGIWLLFILILEFLPQQDLLGILKKKQQEQERVQQLQVAQKQIKQSVSQVNTAVRQLGDSELSSELAKFEIPAAEGLPQEAKRDAIKKLGDLSDRIKDLQNAQSPETLAGLEKMLSQLKAGQDNPLQEFSKALARGNFSQAAALLQDLQKQMDKGEMTEQQKQAMQKQFENIAKQLQQYSQQKKELEQELQKLGLDKQLAKMNPEQLQKELQKQGLNQQTIEQIMDKMKACQAAGQKCSGLANAAGACGSGMNSESMQAMMSELSDLDKFGQQVKLSQAALNQIEQAMASLGEGMGQGIGGMKPYQPGQSRNRGSGSGGPGQGFGQVEKDEDGQTSSSPTKVQGKTVDEGPVIASWYFKDSQVKGQAGRELKDVIQAGKDSAAQAMDENQIPKKYEKAIKGYFGDLEEANK